MYSRGFNYWLTKHGRQRFIERFGMKPDSEILAIAINGAEGFSFIWAPDKTWPLYGRRLVTVLIDVSKYITSSSTSTGGPNGTNSNCRPCSCNHITGTKLLGTKEVL